MRSYRFIAAAAVLSILLTGCSNQQKPSGGDGQTDPAQTTMPAEGQPDAETPDQGGAPDAADPAAEDFDETEGEPEEEPEIDEGAFTWRIEPFLQADDISTLSAGRKEFNYGDFSSSPYMLITRGGKVGLMSRSGEIIIEPECTRAYSYAQEDGDQHIIFTDGDPNAGDRICFCVTTGAMIRTADDVCTLCGGQLKNVDVGRAAVYDPASEILGVMPTDTVRKAKTGDKLKLDGVMSLEPPDLPLAAVARSISLPNGLSQTNVEGEGILNSNYGIVRNGVAMTNFKYDTGTDFKDGVAAVSLDGKWGYLNTAGRLVLPFEFDGDFIYSYGTGDSGPVAVPYLPSEGYIALNAGDKGGFSNMRGEKVIPLGTFAAARPVIDGCAWVKDVKTGLWGVVAVGAAAGGAPAAAQQTQQEQPTQQEEEPARTHAVNGDGWQQAYADVLRSDGTGDTLQFSLCMVDGDDVPELVLHWYDRMGFVQENEDVEMYTFYDGRLIYLGNVSCDGYCTCKYLPQQNMVLAGGMRDDIALYDFKRLENGALNTVCSFNMVMNGEDVNYMIGGKEVEKEAYVAKWKEYYNGDISYDGGMYHNTEENVVGILGVDPLPAEE